MFVTVHLMQIEIIYYSCNYHIPLTYSLGEAYVFKKICKCPFVYLKNSF